MNDIPNLPSSVPSEPLYQLKAYDLFSYSDFKFCLFIILPRTFYLLITRFINTLFIWEICSNDCECTSKCLYWFLSLSNTIKMLFLNALQLPDRIWPFYIFFDTSVTNESSVDKMRVSRKHKILILVSIMILYIKLVLQ